MNDLIAESDLGELCPTETWLMEAGDDISIGEMTPSGFSFLHNVRERRWCCHYLPTASQCMIMQTPRDS